MFSKNLKSDAFSRYIYLSVPFPSLMTQMSSHLSTSTVRTLFLCMICKVNYCCFVQKVLLNTKKKGQHAKITSGFRSGQYVYEVGIAKRMHQHAGLRKHRVFGEGGKRGATTIIKVRVSYAIRLSVPDAIVPLVTIPIFHSTPRADKPGRSYNQSARVRFTWGVLYDMHECETWQILCGKTFAKRRVWIVCHGPLRAPIPAYGNKKEKYLQICI